MARPDIARRLLRKLKMGDLRRLADHFEVPRRKDQGQTIDELMPRVKSDIRKIVAAESPLSVDEWNSIIEVDFGGERRKSYDAIAAELELLLNPAFEYIHGSETVSDARDKTKKDLVSFASALPIELGDLRDLLDRAHGRTTIRSFVSQFLSTRSGEIIIASCDKVSDEHGSTKNRADKPKAIVKLDTNWMADELRGWRNIDIAAGFHDVPFIEDLFGKLNGADQVRLLLNGLRGFRREEQRKEKDNIKKLLDQKYKCKKVDIRFAYAPGLFHTKLFIGRSEPFSKALVGSANATTAAMTRNEEILLSISNAESLAGYFDYMWGKSSDGEKGVQIKSLVSFFRTGVLYFKPQTNLPVSFSPFTRLLDALSIEERRKISQKNIPYSDQTAGIGPMSLLEALKDIEPSLGEESNETFRLSIKARSVETCYGYWMPSAVSESFKALVENASREKKSYLMKLGSALDKKREVIIARFERYFEATKDAIVQGIGPDSFEKYATVSLEEYAKRCVEAFKKFLDRTILRLQNKDQVSALAERFQSGVVPDFWDDFEAYRDFKDSFFSSLFLVQTSDGGSHAAVAKSILNKLQIDPNVNLDVSEETIEEAFEAYLEKSDGWKDEYWPLGDA